MLIKQFLGLAFIIQVLFIGITYIVLTSDDSNTSILKDQYSTNLNSNFFSRRIASSPNSSAENLNEEQATQKHHQTEMSSVTSSVMVATSDVKRRQGGVKMATLLLIMVSTLPDSFIARQSIRDTWLHGVNDSEDAVVRFAVGIKEEKEDVLARLRKENEIHGDLAILEDIKDFYITPTNKTLAMMVWAHDNFNFKYFMKCEPITYVYVKNMVSVLQERPTTNAFYYGKMQYKRRPNRKNSEFKDTAWDLTETYLPFALGGGYILSGDLTARLALHRDYLACRPNEDTAVASWIVGYHFERRDDDLWCVTKLSKNNKLEGHCEDYIIAQMCYGVSEVNLRECFFKIAKH